MYHIGIVNSDKNANYKRDLGLLANYTIPSIYGKAYDYYTYYSRNSW